MRLQNKVVFISGSGGLLGKAVAAQVRAEGGICVCGDLQSGSDVTSGFVYCDVTKEESVKSVFQSLIAEYGRVDGVVNAAYPRTGDWGARLEAIPLQSWQQNVDMQLNSVFLLCREALEIMKKQGYGNVVNFASIYGVQGPDFSVYDGTTMTMPAAYSAIKGGIINFTRYLAAYYGPYQVRVNCISPGGIFDNQNNTFVQNYEAKVPMRRMGTPQDISKPVCFLLSDEASYISGQNLIVDGGWTVI